MMAGLKPRPLALKPPRGTFRTPWNSRECQDYPPGGRKLSIRESGREHGGHAGRVPDRLAGHPAVRTGHEGPPLGPADELAEAPAGRGGIQPHVAGLEP